MPWAARTGGAPTRGGSHERLEQHWRAICVAVSALGTGLSWRIWRQERRHSRDARGRLSLLPLAAYLVGAVGAARQAGQRGRPVAGAFVFSAQDLAGVIVVGLPPCWFLASGGLPLVNWRKNRKRRKVAGRRWRGGPIPAAVPAGREAPEDRKAVEPRRASAKATVPGGSDDDDMKDIQEILRRRGSN